jgi:hypothetical protein
MTDKDVKEAAVANFKVLCNIFLEGMTKTTKNPSGYPVFRYRFGLGTCQS